MRPSVKTENPTGLWSYTKSKGKEIVGVAPLKISQGFIQSDNQIKANILNEQFQLVFTKGEHANFPDKGPSRPYQPLNNITFSVKGV